MTEEDLERLKRRFGPDIAAWPPPHRQEAQLFLAGGSSAFAHDSDAYLDRLVVEAAFMETDEAALARKVLARLNQGRRAALLFHALPSSWRLAAGAPCVLALVVAAGISGFVAGGAGGLDDALLSFAIGDPGPIANELLGPFAQGLG